MAVNFRSINYGRLLYETMRNYFAVNAAGDISQLYEYLAAIIQPLQAPFNAYMTFRITQALIANCMWQIGQLTNVLNYLFDSVLNRIFITQSTATLLSDPTFPYPAVNFDSDFGTAPAQFESTFDDITNLDTVTINVPEGSNIAAITAVVEQIRVSGIPYQIVEQ